MDYSRKSQACTPDVSPPRQPGSPPRLQRLADSPIFIVITIQVFAAFLTFHGHPLEAALAAAGASILIAYNVSRIALPLLPRAV